MLRNIGHRLLLSAKDSSSSVMPVKKLNENTYHISFQNNVGFISDTLINIVQQELEKNTAAKDYIVKLKYCKAGETVLAFEINSHTGNLTPCRGRKMQVGCYIIEVNLLLINQFNFFWLLLIIPLGVVIFYLKNSLCKKQEKIDTEAQALALRNNNYIPLGNFQFYTDDDVLKIDRTTITLSKKETKALKIFVQNPNQIVAREKLMKEIWEDEGIVVISRNVDVLVGKLRKKLSNDNAIKLINVHGRGYKFMIE